MTVESPRCQNAGSSSTCLINDLTLPANSLDTSTENVDSNYFKIHSGVEITAENQNIVNLGDGAEIILSAKDEVNPNVATDLGLWLSFSAAVKAYWTAFEPSDCQHHNGLFNKSY